MTVTLTQSVADVPPVTVAVAGLPAVSEGTVTGIVQRSTDGGIRWTTVRGLAEAETTAGATADVDDYEFRPDVVNTYRAGTVQEIVDTFGRTETDEWGDATTGQTWDAANAAFDVAAGVGTVLHAAANTTFATYIDDPDDVGDVETSVSLSTNAGGAITGGTGTATLKARRQGSDDYSVGVRFNTDGTVSLLAISNFAGEQVLDTAATPLTYTGAETYRIRVSLAGHRIRAKVWDPSATPEPATWQVDETVPLARRITGGQIGLATTRATGNSNANLTFVFDDFAADTGTPTFLMSATITPTLTGVWLCSTMRSFLNRLISVASYEEPAREARGGGNYVAGRTLPIAQVELAAARTWPLTVRVASLAAARELEYAVASGDVFYLLVPADSPIPSGYYRAGSMSAVHGRPNGSARWFTLPLTECAAPGPDVVTASATWDTVIAAYGTWADVVAAVATWEDLLDLVGDPSEVVVDQ